MRSQAPAIVTKLLMWNRIVANTYFISDIESSVGLKFRLLVGCINRHRLLNYVVNVNQEALVKLFIHLAIFYVYLTAMVLYHIDRETTT